MMPVQSSIIFIPFCHSHKHREVTGTFGTKIPQRKSAAFTKGVQITHISSLKMTFNDAIIVVYQKQFPFNRVQC